MKFSLAILLLFSLAFSQGLSLYPEAGNIQYSNFIDDTVNLRYRLNEPDTSEIFGWSKDSHIGPDFGLWCTLFYKVAPDSGADSLDVVDVKLVIQEFDYCPWTKDSVFSPMPDTSADTITITGIATDTVFFKLAFSPNPANGFRVIAIPQAGCSPVMYTTGTVWFHVRKKIGTYQ